VIESPIRRIAVVTADAYAEEMALPQTGPRWFDLISNVLTRSTAVPRAVGGGRSPRT
jgi:hypothetical protein